MTNSDICTVNNGSDTTNSRCPHIIVMNLILNKDISALQENYPNIPLELLIMVVSNDINSADLILRNLVQIVPENIIIELHHKSIEAQQMQCNYFIYNNKITPGVISRNDLILLGDKCPLLYDGGDNSGQDVEQIILPRGEYGHWPLLVITQRNNDNDTQQDAIKRNALRRLNPIYMSIQFSKNLLHRVVELSMNEEFKRNIICSLIILISSNMPDVKNHCIKNKISLSNEISNNWTTIYSMLTFNDEIISLRDEYLALLSNLEFKVYPLFQSWAKEGQVSGAMFTVGCPHFQILIRLDHPLVFRHVHAHQLYGFLRHATDYTGKFINAIQILNVLNEMD